MPVFVEGRLSDFFYRLASLRKRAGLKFNIEMLWLVDEMFAQRGRSFRLVAGEPIPPDRLRAAGSLREQADYVRKKTYSLEKKIAGQRKAAEK